MSPLQLDEPHGAGLLAWVQPLAGSQLSVVQTLPSSQLGGAPPSQPPPPHVSLVLLPYTSLFRSVLLVWPQPLAGSQLSLVQTLPSSQLVVCAGWQLPLLQE